MVSQLTVTSLMPLPLPDFERSPGLIMADIGRLIRKEFDRRSRGLGVTRAQWTVILHIARRPGCSQSELADRLEMEKMTVCRQLDRLELAGWVARGPDAEDRRIKRLQLEPKAVKLLGAVAQIAAGLRRDYLKGFAAKRRETLVDDLLLIKRNLLALDDRSTIAAQ